MKFKSAFVGAVMVGLGGCASMLPPAETMKFSGRGGEFSFVKTGCVLGGGKFTDRTGAGQSRPMVNFIAVTNAGETVGQWTAYCEAVVPNGTSSCMIMGPKKAYYQCSNYDRFMYTN